MNKPCPFCGEPAQVQSYHMYGPKIVGCYNECCYVNPRCSAPTQALAEEKWNKRALETVERDVR